MHTPLQYQRTGRELKQTHEAWRKNNDKKEREKTCSNEFTASPECSLRRTVLFGVVIPNLCGWIAFFDTNTWIVQPLAAQSHTYYTCRRIRTIWLSSSCSPLPRRIYYKYLPRAYGDDVCHESFFKTLHDPVVGHIVRERVRRWRRTRLYCLRCGGGGVVLTIRQRRDLPLDIHCGGGGGTCVTLRCHVGPYP